MKFLKMLYIVIFLIFAGTQAGNSSGKGDKSVNWEQEFKKDDDILVEFIKNKDPDINWMSSDKKNTLLHVAARLNKEKTTNLLIEKGLNINQKNSEGNTPLHFACDAQRVDIVKLLIEKGAKVNEVNNIGKTPLYSAIQKKCLGCVKALIESLPKSEQKKYVKSAQEKIRTSVSADIKTYLESILNLTEEPQDNELKEKLDKLIVSLKGLKAKLKVLKDTLGDLKEKLDEKPQAYSKHHKSQDDEEAAKNAEAAAKKLEEAEEIKKEAEEVSGAASGTKEVKLGKSEAERLTSLTKNRVSKMQAKRAPTPTRKKTSKAQAPAPQEPQEEVSPEEIEKKKKEAEEAAKKQQEVDALAARQQELEEEKKNKQDELEKIEKAITVVDELMKSMSEYPEKARKAKIRQLTGDIEKRERDLNAETGQTSTAEQRRKKLLNEISQFKADLNNAQSGQLPLTMMQKNKWTFQAKQNHRGNLPGLNFAGDYEGVANFLEAEKQRLPQEQAKIKKEIEALDQEFASIQN